MKIDAGRYGRFYIRLWPRPILNVGEYHDLGIVPDGVATKRDDGSYFLSRTRVVLVLNRTRLPLCRFRQTSLS